MIEEKLTPLICQRFLQEEKYRQGHIRIINALPGRRILGLHLPEMKQVVKALTKQADAREFLHAYYYSDKEFGSSHYCIDQYR